MLSALLLFSAAATSCNSFGDKKPDFTITFHAVAGDEDPPKTKFPFDLNGRRMFFKLVPEFSQQNIAAFTPFPAQSGGGKGLVLQLDFRGKSSLELISRTRKDEYLLAMVNAKPVDFVVLDQPVLDGIITIWQGVPDDVIAKMDKKFRRMKKGGGAPNMSDDMEMLPTTKGEKKKAYKAGQDEDRASKGGPKMREPEVPSLNLPTGPVSPSIPVEGNKPAPAPSAPSAPSAPLPSSGSLPLPKP